jgi:hypothetical protein
MSCKISFVPALFFHNQTITLNEIIDQAKNATSGYELKEPVTLGTLGQISTELESFFELKPSAISPDALIQVLPESIRQEFTNLKNDVMSTQLELDHVLVNINTKEKEFTLTGTLPSDKRPTLLGLSIGGFQLSISKGPDGTVKSTDSTANPPTITVTIADRASDVLANAANGKEYNISAYDDSASATKTQVTCSGINGSDLTFTVSQGSSSLPGVGSAVELTP